MKHNLFQINKTRIQSFSSHSIRYNEAKHEQDPGVSINADELKKFQKLSQEWWQESGEFEPLHRYNELRVPWIKNTLFNMNKQLIVNKENYNSVHVKEPLNGLNILGQTFLLIYYLK